MSSFAWVHLFWSVILWCNRGPKELALLIAMQERTEETLSTQTLWWPNYMQWLNIEWLEGFKIFRHAIGKNVLNIQWMALILLLMFRWLEEHHGNISIRYFLKSKFSVDGTFHELWYWLMHHLTTGKKINGQCLASLPKTCSFYSLIATRDIYITHFLQKSTKYFVCPKG